MTASEEVVMCAGGCGKHWPLSGVLEGTCPWEQFSVRYAVRCWDCGRALTTASHAGADVEATYANIPPHSRGALKKMPDRPPLHEAPGKSSGSLEWE